MSAAAPSPRRLSVKFMADPPDGPLDLEPYIGLFHRFIQERSLEGLLIDVADYAHVPDGPGILLVGHEVDYGVDLGGGRPGLLVTRKRHGDAGLPRVLEDALRKGLVALAAIARSGVGALRFRTDSLQIQILDRLVAPNAEAGFEALRAGAEPVLAALYGKAGLELVRDHAGDPRRPLALRVAAVGAPDAEALLARLGGSGAVPAADAQSPWDISVEELARLRDAGEAFALLDVREVHEFEICNLGGKLVPLSSLAGRLAELDREARLVVHCRSGARSARAVELLRSAGFEAWNVNGGILAWIERVDPSLTRY